MNKSNDNKYEWPTASELAEWLMEMGICAARAGMARHKIESVTDSVVGMAHLLREAEMSVTTGEKIG